MKQNLTSHTQYTYTKCSNRTKLHAHSQMQTYTHTWTILHVNQGGERWGQQPCKYMCARVCINGYAYMYTNVHALTHTYRVHSCTYLQKKNICGGQRFSMDINSNKTLTDTNPEIKKNHDPIKTTATKKDRKKRLL